MAVLGNDQLRGFVSLTVLDKVCWKLVEIIGALCAADACTHPDPPNNSQHHENRHNDTCACHTKWMHNENIKIEKKQKQKPSITKNTVKWRQSSGIK